MSTNDNTTIAPRLWWIIILGGAGFLVGFLGPIVLVPEANQGPLLGIFITGPLGGLLGVGFWLLSRFLDWSAPLQWRLLKGASALFVLTTLIILVLL